jgi:hypothetical protein
MIVQLSRPKNKSSGADHEQGVRTCHDTLEEETKLYLPKDSVGVSSTSALHAQ